jgi:succinate-semialdehyde dehydrogenase/glutarate-semialdehyde dehydrogenase
MKPNLNLTNPDLIQTGLLINGDWITLNRETFLVSNPATSEEICKITIANASDMESAVSSAQITMKKWQQTSLKERCKIIKAWAELIIANADDLAKILTIEQGKPLPEAKGEILYGASYFEWYAEEAKRIYGETIPANQPNQRILIQHEPVGVCAAITPWNFPNAMLARKVAPALAAGCAMIAKPASQTPLSANALAYLGIQAGIPAGLLNIIHGHSGQIGEFFCSNLIIRKLTFTGSTEVGIWLYQNCANTMKKMSLELGGNAPLIVFDDADIDLAVEGIIKSKFRNSGQTCVCSNRIFIHNSIREQVIEKLKLEISGLKLGNGLENGINLGPLIDSKAVTHAKSLIEDAITNRAELICGGSTDSNLGELFFRPTLINCKTTNLRLFKEEIFAPILAVYGFDSDEEVINLANSTPYGLASYFFSQNINRIYKVAEGLQYGMVGVNTGMISGENVPFGGIKMSGIGREGGHQGIEEYLQTKYICMSLA